MGNRDYTPGQVAKMSGVSVRALHHYDRIGLLVPRRRANGYRCYSSTDVARLQQILLFRACGLELVDIGALLDSPGFDATRALRGHIAQLKARRRELDQLIATVERTVAHMEGEVEMDDDERFEGLKREAIERNERAYGVEVRRRWGDEVADGANERLVAKSREEWDDMKKLEQAVKDLLRAAMATGDPSGSKARELCLEHGRWLSAHWPAGQYTAEAHRGMAAAYLADERFVAYYDGACGTGATKFLKKAIDANADAVSRDVSAAGTTTS